MPLLPAIGKLNPRGRGGVACISWIISNLGLLIGSLLAHRLIFRDILRRTGAKVAMLTAILLTPMITFVISYQACWLWIRLGRE